MASASSSSAKLLYGDSKARINQRVRYTVDGIGSLSRNLVRCSKSSETLMQAAKVSSQQEHILESADLVWIFMSFIIVKNDKLTILIFNSEFEEDASPCDASRLSARIHREQFQSICQRQRAIPRTSRLIIISLKIHNIVRVLYKSLIWVLKFIKQFMLKSLCWCKKYKINHFLFY